MSRILLAAALVALAGCSASGVDGGSSGSGSQGTTAGSGSTSTGATGSSTASSSSSGGQSTGSLLDGVAPWSYDGGDPCEPHPPAAVVDLRMPTSTRTVPVNAGDDLQAALDAAQPGDELVLAAGATFTGNFELQPKSGNGWVVVRTSDLSSLPPLGQRIDPTQVASHLPKILTNNSVPAISAQSGAAFWRFVGVEVGFAPGVATNYNLVLLGDGTQTVEADLPHHIVFDRSWIHGNDTGDLRRGITLNGDSIGIVGCDVSNFHEVGGDSQALAGWNGGGPFTVLNNYLEGAAETVLFGGADPKVPNLVPSDIALVHNTLSKRLTWKSDDPSYAGVNYVVKNTLELKNARRVWIEGNVIERSWPMGQVGYLLLFTPRNQEGTAPWSGVTDVTVVNNVLRHGAGGTNLEGTDDEQPSQPVARIRVWNDLFYDLGNATWGNSPAFQFLTGGQGGVSGASCIDFQHLTADNGRSNLGAIGDSGTIADAFTFSNNIVSYGQYGFHSPLGEGTAGLNAFFTHWAFASDVIYGDGTDPLASPSAYPDTNQFAASLEAVGFVDAASADYHLASTSPYKATASDGTDPGADLDAIDAAVQ